MNPTSRFIQGAFSFTGRGLDRPHPLHDSGRFTVPADKRAQIVYVRAGNSSEALLYLVLCRDGKPMRYFPVGAKAGIHVPLTVVEDVFPESKLEILVAAPEGTSGTVVLDVGILEVD
ncbi:MAG TPA: molybdopterin oxidoreductase [Polyangiaceae bacterium]|nr:molybdopterin oxidoreductase [Polyangiaceae bacterium]